MDYSYDYGALQRFMAAHNLSKRDLLEAFNTADYAGVNRWLQGRTPVHLTAMLRFCNYYSVPLSWFIRDDDDDAAVHFTHTDDTTIRDPRDGYGHGTAAKVVSNPHITERKIGSKRQQAAVEEGLQRQRKEKGETAMEETAPPSASNGQQNDAGISNENIMLELKHSQEIIKLEREHHERENQIRRDCQASFDAERNRLMDIIERQSAELAKLYQRQSYDADNAMVAEDKPI